MGAVATVVVISRRVGAVVVRAVVAGPSMPPPLYTVQFIREIH